MFKLRIKPKSMNTTISVICYKSKTLANGEHPLMLRITQNRKTQYKSLNISVAAKHFEKNTPIEKKTGKKRTLRINPQLQQHIVECYEQIQPISVKSPILVSQKGTIFTIQRINVILKEIKKKYRLKVKNFSCHSLRKTFGRQVYNMNSENSELALVKLMELFNHSSIAITKRYLGLRQEEILETYDVLSF